MDTTAGEIIVQAFRDGGFLAGDASIAEEMQEALPRLNSMIFSMLGLELGESFTDWPAPPMRTSPIASRYPLGPLDEALPAEAWTNPPAGVRVVALNAKATTIFFPNNPRDGALMAYADGGSTATLTLDGNGRKIEGASTIVGTTEARRWFYRADLGNWVRLARLQMTDAIPLPPEFDELFICGLVLKLSSRFKVEPSQYTAACYTDMLSRLKKRYKQGAATVASADFPRMTARPTRSDI